MVDENFSISQKTFEKLSLEKSKTGFEKQSWDDWFNHVFQAKVPSKQHMMEDVIRRFFYKNDFDEWVKNFALNLNDIWNGASASDLDFSKNSNVNSENDSAIVIGRGPSLQKHNHLELLRKSNFKGSIICTDGALKHVLESGITPEKFPKFYVVTIESYEDVFDLYDDEIIDKYGSRITGIFTIITNPKVISRVKTAKIKINWLHPLADYHEGKKSFNQMTAQMIKARSHEKGLAAIQTGGNVGTSSWFIGWRILKCKNIVLIGLNQGWEEDDSWEKIISHGNYIKPTKIDRKSSQFKKLFPKIYNPDFKTYCILDPTFQYYSSAFKEFISRSPSWVNTINATEGGSLFGDRITSMKFVDFLKKYA